MAAKIPLQDWAATKYDPPPSLWVLRKWVRSGEISPTPELVGKTYYVEPTAFRVTPENVRAALAAREAETA